MKTQIEQIYKKNNVFEGAEKIYVLLLLGKH